MRKLSRRAGEIRRYRFARMCECTFADERASRGGQRGVIKDDKVNSRRIDGESNFIKNERRSARERCVYIYTKCAEERLSLSVLFCMPDGCV